MNLKIWCKNGARRQAELAIYLQVTPSAVSQAVNGDIRIPPDWYRGIVEFTKGEVNFTDLAPAGKTSSGNPSNFQAPANYEQAAMQSVAVGVALAETRVSAYPCKKLITVRTPSVEAA